MPLRGGRYNTTMQAGVFALNLNNRRSLSEWNVGFRAALPSKPDTYTLRGAGQCRGIKGFASMPQGRKYNQCISRKYPGG